MAEIALMNDLSPAHLLQDWFKILCPSEQAFVTSKLGALQYLSRLQLDWTLLRDLISRWDPTTYTFRFGTLELAPTYEEYLHFSELPHRPGVLPLPRLGSPQNNLSSVLRLSAASTHCLITPQKYILVEEILKFQASPYLTSKSDGQTSARAFILFFAGTILYPFTACSIHERSVFLAKAILEDRPFIPNILGETYFSITRIHARLLQGVRSHRPTFCPHLLQAWFVTHLRETGRLLNTRHHPRLLERISDRDYLSNQALFITRQYLEELAVDEIFPMAKCFQFGPVIVNSKDGSYIPIMGITGSSYYTPLRVAHQFGGTAEASPPPSILFPPIDLETAEAFKTRTQNSIGHISRIWQQLVTVTFIAQEVDQEQTDDEVQQHKMTRRSRGNI